MTKTELKEFKVTLKARQIELAQMMRKRDGIAIEKTPDALDETQLATERELATRNLERESKLLRSVRQALSRIDQGTYGLCLNCEEEISAKRLKTSGRQSRTGHRTPRIVARRCRVRGGNCFLTKSWYLDMGPTVVAKNYSIS